MHPAFSGMRRRKEKSGAKNKKKLSAPEKKERGEQSSASLKQNPPEDTEITRTAAEKKQEIPDESEKSSLLSRILTLSLATVLTLIFVGSGLFAEAEIVALRWIARLNAVPPEKDRVVIVNIDDDDYAALFESKSPLNPNRLQEIIELISRGNPKVIGVDIDTSDKSFAAFQTQPEWSPIVWAQTVDFDAEGEMVCCLNPLASQPLRAKDKTAPPVLPKDPDAESRRYQLFFEYEGEVRPTFIYQILSLYDPPKFNTFNENTDSFFTRFAGSPDGSHRLNISPSHILQTKDDEEWLRSKLEGKVVLLGGTFTEAKDTSMTPLGIMSGVNILASAVETELTGTGLKSPNRWYRFLISLFEALFLIIIFNRFTTKMAILICLISVLPFTLFLSLLIYGSFAGFVYFLPTLALFVVYKIADKLKDYQRDKVTESVEIGTASVKNWLGKSEKKP